MLKLETANNIPLARRWFMLAVVALGVAGLFSLPPVFLRGPWFESYFDTHYIFDVSLILHVNLSVLYWMLAMAGCLWSFCLPASMAYYIRINWWAAVLGTALVSLSVFIPESRPVKNNYVPVLQNVLFFIGLSLFLCAIALQAFYVLFRGFSTKNVLKFGLWCAAVTFWIAAIAFALSAYRIESYEVLGAAMFYEQIFWSGGHLLQFTFAILASVCWIGLAEALYPKGYSPIRYVSYLMLFAFSIIVCAPMPVLHVLHPQLWVTMPQFTQHMIFVGGVTSGVIGLMALYHFVCKKTRHLELSHIASKRALVLSILLFGYGGALAFMISGTNVTIPAHYHGSVVGITLALMGMGYYLLPVFGYAQPLSRVARWQPVIYGGGQFLHITGLAWMGGYGALRKAPGTSDAIDNLYPKLMFFAGGSLAILGGLMFILAMIIAIRKRRQS